MKRIVAAILFVFLLCGCGNSDSLHRAIELRERINKGNICSFNADIQAEYGERIYTFSMKCSVDQFGELIFEVTEPETISGITGRVSAEGGKLTFDDQVLLFETIMDGIATPVSAPWLIARLLRSGYINACGQDGEGIHMRIEDSYDGEKICADIFTDSADLPIRGELFWDNRRIVTVDIENFIIK